MKSYVIHFIRHGAIDETLSGKYIGSTDVPLSRIRAGKRCASSSVNAAIRIQR